MRNHLWAYLVFVLWGGFVSVGSFGGACFASPPDRADVRDTINVSGNGEAAIADNDSIQARQKALDMALQDAFENALAQAVPDSLSLSDRRDLLRDLSPNMNRFLVRYRFEEMPLAEEILITVEATFSRPLLLEEFKKRGLFAGRRETKVDPIAIYVSLQGIQQVGTYNDILDGLPKRIDDVQSVVPYEIFGNKLVLRVLYKGTVEAFRDEASRALRDMFSPDLAPGEELDVLISLNPSEADHEGRPVGSQDNPALDGGAPKSPVEGAAR